MTIAILGFLVFGLGCYLISKIRNMKVGRTSTGLVAGLESILGSVLTKSISYIVFATGFIMMSYSARALF